ncbi:MAG: hypothetical protein D6742_15385 [Cyanobacteria bacterium J069]|nr:MAG: hypothetical protein D6742_15385 [Cyanobacteria bacterium J069]
MTGRVARGGNSTMEQRFWLYLSWAGFALNKSYLKISGLIWVRIMRSRISAWLDRFFKTDFAG